MVSAAVAPVPIPSVAPLPPAMPWWEWALIALLLVGTLAYVASLTHSWWRRRAQERSAQSAPPAESRRRLSRRGTETVAALVILMVVVIQVNVRWTAHREQLRVEQATDAGIVTEAFARDLGDAYGVTVDPQWISVIRYPGRDSDIVEVTRTDGARAQCWLWVDTAGVERTATLEIDSCTESEGT